jgi:superfamily II DNA or RNA helicase
MTRRFGNRVRAWLWVIQKGRCQACGRVLTPGWHVDHKRPWGLGGPTTLDNAQALCGACNLRKGGRLVFEDITTEYSPRKWQRAATDEYLRLPRPRFLLEACPGAGKTKWALSVARELLDSGEIDRVVVVCPLKTVRRQWAADAKETFDLNLVEPYIAKPGGAEPKNCNGLVITYGALLERGGSWRAEHFAKHCELWRTLVILDEIHHCAQHLGWGIAAMDAFGIATRVLTLSGTPFRRQGQIPFVEYEADPDDPQQEICRPDFRWTYTQELAERPSGVRRVEPILWDGEIEWKTSDGEAYGPFALSDALTGENAERLMRARLRAALDPTQPYFQHVFRMAHEQLLAIRESMPDAGGLILARSRSHARAIRAMVRERFGVEAILAVGSDNHFENKTAEANLERFKRTREPWLIAVGMVSEGYDNPRLRVLVYGTTRYTAWSVIQAIGRVVRGDDTAFVFAPGDPRAHALFGRIFEGFVVAKTVPPEPDDDDDGVNGNGGDGRSAEVITTAASPTTAALLIEGGQFTDQDVLALREAAARHGLRAAGIANVAGLYCEAAGIDLQSEDVRLLEQREDARVAVLSVHVWVRRQVNDLVTQVAQRLGCREVELNVQIKGRWTARQHTSLTQLWEIRRWLRGHLG